MAQIIQRGGRFSVEVKHNFGRPNEELLDYLRDLDNKIRTTVIRKMVSAAGTTLAKAIRKQLKELEMPYSRGRNPAERKKLRQQGTKPLARTIGKRVWSKAHKGIIGVVVGPTWPQGAHGHLVEFGHVITGKARVRFKGLRLSALRRRKFKTKIVRIGRRSIKRAGERTVAHGFQKAAMGNVEREMFFAMAQAMSAALKKLGNPHIKANIVRQMRAAPLPF